jgi:hypothetical protein
MKSIKSGTLGVSVETIIRAHMSMMIRIKFKRQVRIVNSFICSWSRKYALMKLTSSEIIMITLLILIISHYHNGDNEKVVCLNMIFKSIFYS